MSFRLGTHRCAVVVFTGASGKARQCGSDPTHAGVRLVTHRNPIELWLAFACDEHADQLTGARRLLERDRARMERWERERRKALAGEPWDRPAPIAVGAEARRRAERIGLRGSQGVHHVAAPRSH